VAKLVIDKKSCENVVLEEVVRKLGQRGILLLIEWNGSQEETK
jgi:hypothetical protein